MFNVASLRKSERLISRFPAGATDVLPSVRRSYPPQLPEIPHMALVDPLLLLSLFLLSLLLP